MIEKIYSIGVYGTTEKQFFNKLIDNRIDVFYDIRRRRGIRGSKYSFVNSLRLQKRLGELGIKYYHVIELAPTNEIREVQKISDKNVGVLKKERSALAPAFKLRYKDEILNKFNFIDFAKRLEKEDVKRIVLFCVERAPEACHRFLVAEELMTIYNLSVQHL